MHNHNKAQQSKNRAHTSWDILYTPTNTRERNTPRAHLLICTDGHTQHALKYRCAYTYMCIWSIKKQKKIHTHTKEITQICTNTQIYAYPYTHIYIQPFMCDGVCIKLNIPDPHTQWHCPGINPIIQCNVQHSKAQQNRVHISWDILYLWAFYRWHGYASSETNKQMYSFLCYGCAMIDEKNA